MLMAIQHGQLDWRMSARRRSVARGMEWGGSMMRGRSNRWGRGGAVATAGCVDTGAAPGRTQPVQTQEACKRILSRAFFSFLFLEQMFHSYWVMLSLFLRVLERV